MLKTIIVLIFMGITLNSINLAQEGNPFFKEFGTPFETPPFDKIKIEHYKPAFLEGMKIQKEEVDKILNNKEEPTFENTIEALENSGKLLSKVSGVFYNLTSSNTNDEMQSISKEIAPLLSKHRDDISLNEKLFERLNKIFGKKETLNLTPEQNKVLNNYYKDFVRAGANLDEEKKNQLRKINEELSVLSLKFGENVLKENNSYELVIEKEEDLSGLPEDIKSGAAETAKNRGKEGKWVFTLHIPSMLPFLQYADNRELRKQISTAYINRGNNNNELDNKKILSRIAALRVEKANLLGYKNHAEFVLEENMAKTPEKVYEFLNNLWDPALKMAKKEAEELQQMIKKSGENFKLEPWDWRYYAEKLRKEKYNLDEEMLRPYFKLENVIEGVFYVSNKLFGVSLEERKDIPVYHEDVKVFEVKDKDGSHVGILFVDYFPRESKRGGAWMNDFRGQSNIAGEMITPVICNVGNFSKPVGDKPALISFDEVNTLFHEFGHALHGLLSDVTYPSVSGTSVARDFVELPSQIMENWASDPEVLKIYAKHYLTGEVIPDELIKKIKDSQHYGQGFATTEYLAASLLDLDWHTLETTEEQNVIEFENKSLAKIGLIPEIVVRYRSPYFSHIFSGGYSAGYYSYIWAEVLDADAFQAFKETNVFDSEKGMKFRDNILSRGGTEEPMELYKKFRGKEPSVEALLIKRGLK